MRPLRGDISRQTAIALIAYYPLRFPSLSTGATVIWTHWIHEACKEAIL